MNDPSDKNHVPGAKVVAAYAGGSRDIPNSWDRLPRFTAELRDKYGVEIVDSIPALLDKVDAVLLESVDGRPHLKQVKPVFEAGKRVFIDKPLSSSWSDAKEIARLGKQHGVPWWSASSLRYSPAVEEVAVEGLTGALSWGPASLEPHHELDLSWYGIHPIELLYSVLGPGCESVERTFTAGADVIVGHWPGGKLGTVRTMREGKSAYGIVAFGEKEVKVSTNASGQYSALMGDIVQFFRDSEPPVPNAETLAVFAFMEAARLSRQQGGKLVKLPTW